MNASQNQFIENGGIESIVTTNSDEKVNDEGTKEDGIPVLGIAVAAVLILVPIAICVTMSLISRKCPNSNLGRKLNACKAGRALTEEQMKLRDVAASEAQKRRPN